MNGDGWEDVVAAAELWDATASGRVLFFPGGSAGVGSPSATWQPSSGQANAKITRVATAGDVDADGYADILFVSPNFTNSETNEGKVYLYRGGSGGPAAVPIWTIESNIANFSLLEAAPAGDTNGDGYADFLVGASYAATNGIGQIWLYYGSPSGTPGGAPAGWWSYTGPSGSKVGTPGTLASAGDVNGDGLSDVIFGGPGLNYGRAYVYHGSWDVIGGTSIFKEPNQLNANMGVSVGAAGDVNGDGYDDVLVGAPYYDSGYVDRGRVYVYYGDAGGSLTTSAILQPLGATSGGTRFGFSVAGDTDLNADGFADVVVGEPDFGQTKPQAGRVLVYHGGASGVTSTPSTTRESDQQNAHFGHAVAPAGDVNGDGCGDIVVWDNLGIHTDPDVAAAIVARGARLEFLPPYSPEFNPIEAAWSKMKGILRAAKARTVDALVQAVGEALEAISPTDCHGWFKHAGYATT